MSGRLGDLSAQQVQCLASLHTLIDECPDEVPKSQTRDVDLLRFLRARSFHVDSAFKQWRTCQEWRLKFGAETILDGPYPLEQELKNTLACSYHGHDHDYRPLYVERSGAVDPNLIAHLDPDEIIRRHVYHQEKQVRRTEENARECGNEALDSWCEIHDMKGLSIQHRQVLSVFTQLARLDTDYYPERAGKIFFVNVPAVFPALWKICRRALDTKTREKFVVLSASRSGELLDYFSPDQLPVEYGGAVQGLFPALPSPGRRESRPLAGVRFQEAQVLARRRSAKFFDCSAGDVATWYFRVPNKYVKFSVYWSTDGQPTQPDNPVHASKWLEGAMQLGESLVVSASSEGFSDTHFCNEGGVIALVWENDSIFQNRSVTYQMSIDHASKYGANDDAAADLLLKSGSAGHIGMGSCASVSTVNGDSSLATTPTTDMEPVNGGAAHN